MTGAAVTLNISTATPTADRSSRWLAAAIIILYLLLYLLPLGVRPLLIPDETRYAEIPREILSRGDWVVPHYDGLRYFEKPPLGYWLNAGSIAILGENTFAARLPSALAAGLTTLLVFLFARSSLRSQRLALYAALIHLSFFEVYLVGTFSVLDNFLSLFLSTGIVSFYMAARAAPGRRALLYWIISGLSLGLAFLTKGFLALAIPVIVLVPWMLWQRKWRSLFSYGWLAVLIAALVAMPWAILIHARESDFWHYFFWVEHIHRFSSSHAQHKAPFYYFLVALPLLAFPWLSFAPAAISGLKEKSHNSDQTALFRFLWLWLLLPIGFFSASNGKLATYILPCFPPMAVLMAAGLQQYLRRPSIRLFNMGLLLNFIFFAIALITLVVIQSVYTRYAIYHSDEWCSYLAVMLSLIAVLIAGVIAFKSKHTHTIIMSIALSFVPLLLIAHLAFPDRASAHKSPGVLIQQHSAQIPANAIVIADSYVIGAVSWTLHRNDIYLISPGELEYGLQYPDAKHRLLRPDDLSALLLKNQYTHPVAMVCSDGCADGMVPQLPADAVRYSYGIFDLWLIPALNDTSATTNNVKVNTQD